jgi:hypothetical protein
VHLDSLQIVDFANCILGRLTVLNCLIEIEHRLLFELLEKICADNQRSLAPSIDSKNILVRRAFFAKKNKKFHFLYRRD